MLNSKVALAVVRIVRRSSRLSSAIGWTSGRRSVPVYIQPSLTMSGGSYCLGQARLAAFAPVEPPCVWAGSWLNRMMLASPSTM